MIQYVSEKFYQINRKRLYCDFIFLINVIVFLPFGILLKKLNYDVEFGFWIFLLVSLFFETIQYILSIGVSDTTDIITNVIGGVVGMVVVNILNKNK